MPIIKIWGLLPRTKHEHLIALIRSINEIIVNIKPLKLGEDDISFFFPSDCFPLSLGGELVVEICGLFKKPERTNEVKAELTKKILKAVISFAGENVPDCRKVEVFITEIDPDESGYAIVVFVSPKRR